MVLAPVSDPSLVSAYVGSWGVYHQLRALCFSVSVPRVCVYVCLHELLEIRKL